MSVPAHNARRHTQSKLLIGLDLYIFLQDKQQQLDGVIERLLKAQNLTMLSSTVHYHMFEPILQNRRPLSMLLLIGEIKVKKRLKLRFT